MTELTEKQKKFCEEYLVDFNQGAAYLRAGYKCSDNSARTNASRMLTNDNIQAYLTSIRNKAGSSTAVTLERTLQELAYVAYGRVTDVLSFSDNGMSVKNSDTLPDEVVAAIASVDMTESGGEYPTIKKSVKLHNKVAALALLAKFFGIDSDFNQARASLKRYGLALVEDSESDSGWRIDRHVA
jgi:phage terminase small subunit